MGFVKIRVGHQPPVQRDPLPFLGNCHSNAREEKTDKMTEVSVPIFLSTRFLTVTNVITRSLLLNTAGWQMGSASKAEIWFILKQRLLTQGAEMPGCELGSHPPRGVGNAVSVHILITEKSSSCLFAAGTSHSPELLLENIHWLCWQEQCQVT